MSDGTSRRAFLAQALIAGAAPSLSPALPLRSPAGRPRKHVAVLGAGLAGLAAAYELSNAGHRVTVLEARSRPGGRVYTLREPFSDGLYAEAGAIVISDAHRHTLHYVRLFGLPLDPVLPRDLPPRYYIRGKHVKVLEKGRVQWPVALTADEQRLGLFGMIDRYVGRTLKTLGDPAAPDWPPPRVLAYDRMTFAEFLRRQGASPAAVEVLGPLYSWWGDGIEHVSALFLLRDSVLGFSGERFYTIRGGNDRLPNAFAAKLAGRIHYDAAVRRIEQDAERVRIVFTRSGTRREMTADYAISTIPFSVMRHVDVSPPFSAEKRRAIAELPYTSVARVYLQSRTKFWLDGGPNGWTYTDLPIMNVLDSTFNQPGPRGILHAYMAGAQARRVTRMPEGERLRFTLEQMERVHPGIRDAFEVGTSKCWDEDEWSRGDYPWARPGQMSTLLPHVGTPEGRVYFAGDYASATPGWMQGALESGRRAAELVGGAR